MQGENVFLGDLPCVSSLSLTERGGVEWSGDQDWIQISLEHMCIYFNPL